MKSNTYKALLNKEGKYSTFELPEGVSFTRRAKATKASVNFSLVYSEDSTEAGAVYFETVEEAKQALNHNKGREGVKSLELLLKIDGEWYKEDGVTLRFPKEITIWDVKKDLGITDAEIAEMFDFANTNSYATSSAKKRYEAGLVTFYKLIKERK